MKIAESAAKIPPFDLRYEKWILVIDDNGNRDELGLEDVLLTAHQWRGINDPLPTVEFGIYRLLVAFVLDIFKPKNGEDWADLWDEGKFDERKIRSYFDDNKGTFNLFGERPFLQSLGLEDDKITSVARMAHSFPSGSNAIHFHHCSQIGMQISPAVAARWLTAVSPFAIQDGRGYFTGINGSPPWYVVPVGKTAFETLLLNTPVFADLFQANGDELPAWRSSVPTGTEKLKSASMLQSLTWRPRRVELISDQKGGICSSTGQWANQIVRSIKYAGGEGTDFEWTDPNAAYSIGEKRLPIKPQPNKEIWRDIGALALLNQQAPKGKKDFALQRPAIVSQISELIKESLLPKGEKLQISVYGLRCKEANLFEWQQDELNVPIELLWEDVGQNEAQGAIKLAEDVASRLSTSIRLTARPRTKEAEFKAGNGKEPELRNKAALKYLIEGTSKFYWRNLRPHYEAYLEFLGSKPDPKSRTKELQKWRYILRDVGWDALRSAIEKLDTDADALRRQTKAYEFFDQSLFWIIEPEKAAILTEKNKNKEAKS